MASKPFKRAATILSLYSMTDINGSEALPARKSEKRVQVAIQEVRNAISNDVASKSLPRADGGKDAWLFLVGCFVLEALVWGFPFSFGVFQSYYTANAPFSQKPNGIAAIGTCSGGVMYLVAPVTLYLLEAWPSIRRLSSIIGLFISVSALIASSFSTHVWHLILTQGILYAIGGSLLYSPTMFYLDEWFIKRKGLAFGIMWAGAGTSGLIFPFLLTYLLDRYGFARTLRIWGLVLLILTTPLIYFIKPRLSISATPKVFYQRPSYSFLKSRTFFFLQLSNIIESLAFFLPSIYMPLYILTLSTPLKTPSSSSILLALINTFSVLGAIGLGHLCDVLSIYTCIAISSLGATLSILLFWGLGKNMTMLVLFATSYGLFAGGFSALWTGMMKEVQNSGQPTLHHPRVIISAPELGPKPSLGATTRDPISRRQEAEAGMGPLMGLFAAGRGIGAVTSGPISEILLAHGRLEYCNKHEGGHGYWGEYGALIVFAGLSAFCSLIAFGGRTRRMGTMGGKDGKMGLNAV